MTNETVADLRKLGLLAAQQVAGVDSVLEVDVAPGEDSSERPVYFFSFLIDQDRARQRAGLVRIRLMQRLRDDLVARGDEHHPMVQILDHSDWDRRRLA